MVGDGIRAWPWSVALQWLAESAAVDLGKRAVPPEAAAALDASFAAQRSPGLAAALGHAGLT